MKENTMPGRRGLFLGTEPEEQRAESVPLQEITDIITRIATSPEENLPTELPEIWNPLLRYLQKVVEEKRQIASDSERITHDLGSLQGVLNEKTRELERISGEYQVEREKSSEDLKELSDNLARSREELGRISGEYQAEREKSSEDLKELSDNLARSREELNKISAEHETYLSDLIRSHTEFDRALEIFQYHSIPMVLLDEAGAIHDANDAFCSLFSISRSEITSAFPLLQTYVQYDAGFITLNSIRYDIISVSPPIIPFSQDFSSLILFIQREDRPDMHLPGEEGLITEIPLRQPPVLKRYQEKILEGFDELPFSVALINEVNTIIAENKAFLELVRRERSNVHLRDLGSSGFSAEDASRILESLQSGERMEDTVLVSGLNGSEIPVYIQVIPLSGQAENAAVSILICMENPDEIAAQNEEIPSTSLPSTDISSPLITSLMDLNPSAVALLDASLKILRVNEGFSELSGVSQADLVGAPIEEMGLIKAERAVACEDILISEDITVSSQWGSQKFSSILLPLSRSPSEAEYLLVLQPAELQQDEPVEEPLHHQVEAPEVLKPDYVAMIQISPLPGVILDGSHILEVNEVFCQFSGFTRGSLIGKDEGDIFPVRRDESSGRGDGTLHVLWPAGEKDLQVFEHRIPMPDGKEKTIRLYADVSGYVTKSEQDAQSLQEMRADIIELKSQLEKSEVDSEIKRTEAANIDIVEFELHNERYAIDITMVREVVDMVQITPLPKTPAYVIGIINLRGEITHIIDLSILMGESSTKDRSEQKIIIIPHDMTNGEHIGIIVDNVQSVTEIMGRQVNYLGEDVHTHIKTHIKGIIKIAHTDNMEHRIDAKSETELVIWLDIKKILSDLQGS